MVLVIITSIHFAWETKYSNKTHAKPLLLGHSKSEESDASRLIYSRSDARSQYHRRPLGLGSTLVSLLKELVKLPCKRRWLSFISSRLVLFDKSCRSPDFVFFFAFHSLNFVFRVMLVAKQCV